MKRRLFEAPAVPRRKTSKELVPVDSAYCPECGAVLLEETTGERALLRHGGYGAERVTVRAHCAVCGWTMVREVSEVRP